MKKPVFTSQQKYPLIKIRHRNDTKEPFKDADPHNPSTTQQSTPGHIFKNKMCTWLKKQFYFSENLAPKAFMPIATGCIACSTKQKDLLQNSSTSPLTKTCFEKDHSFDLKWYTYIYYIYITTTQVLIFFFLSCQICERQDCLSQLQITYQDDVI